MEVFGLSFIKRAPVANWVKHWASYPKNSKCDRFLKSVADGRRFVGNLES